MIIRIHFAIAKMEGESRGRQEERGNSSPSSPMSLSNEDHNGDRTSRNRNMDGGWIREPSPSSSSSSDGRIRIIRRMSNNPFSFLSNDNDSHSTRRNSAERRNIRTSNDDGRSSRSGQRPLIITSRRQVVRERREAFLRALRETFNVGTSDTPNVRPADRAAVQQLAHIIISEEYMNSNSSSNSECSICHEPYRIGEEARAMECGHMHHQICLFEWLENHRTCPLCRFELP